MVHIGGSHIASSDVLIVRTMFPECGSLPDALSALSGALRLGRGIQAAPRAIDRQDFIFIA